MDIFVEKGEEVYLEKAGIATGSRYHTGKMPVSVGGVDSPGGTGLVPSGAQTGAPRIMMDVKGAMDSVMGKDTYANYANDHYGRAIKCMQQLSKMCKTGECQKERMEMMKKLSAMHSDLADRFTGAMEKSGDYHDMDGLMAASSYANRAHDMLEKQLKDREQMLMVQGYGTPAADPPLYLQATNQPLAMTGGAK